MTARRAYALSCLYAIAVAVALTATDAVGAAEAGGLLHHLASPFLLVGPHLVGPHCVTE